MDITAGKRTGNVSPPQALLPCGDERWRSGDGVSSPVTAKGVQSPARREAEEEEAAAARQLWWDHDGGKT